MFFFLPWGHDQPVYERPWATYALVLSCVIVFAITSTLEAEAMPAVENAAYRLSILSDAFPDARVSFSIDGLPRELDTMIQPLVDTSPDRVARPGDAELEAAMLDLVAGLNRLPVFQLGFRPGAPSVVGAVAHAFVHADVFHLLGNMLFLWLAGGVLECFWRRWAYLGLYALAGFAGLGAQAFASLHSMTPMIGASGCIAGLMGAFLVGYPRTKIKIAYVFWFGLRPRFGSTLVPAWFALPAWVLVELGSALLAPPEAGGVAYWAHVGGFACGALVALVAGRLGLVADDAGYDIVRGGGEAPRSSVLGAPIPDADRRSARPAPVLSTRPPPREIEAHELPPPSDDDRIER